MNTDILIGLKTELSSALEELISLFCKDTMRWFARLYDPRTGAFYYSNSARDYEGFGPDLESTVQCLRCVAYRGMLDSYGGSMREALPAEMISRMVLFTKSCADPDGYYYHPQWGKSISLNRRAHDLVSAMQILEWFDERPPYPVASHRPIVASEGGAEPSGFLRSRADLFDFLDGMMNSETLNSTANFLASTSSQIKAAGLLGDLLDYLDACRNAENGLWGKEATYSAISALSHLVGLYTMANRRLALPERTLSSCIEAALSSEAPDTISCVCNTHVSIHFLIQNMDKSGDKAASSYVKKSYASNIVPIIYKTCEKLSVFRKPDGSFSYMPDRSACKSQAAPVALYMENEGDVNATSLALNSCVGLLLHNLDIAFKIYNKFDYSDFISILMAQTPAKKRPVPLGRESSEGRF